MPTPDQFNFTVKAGVAAYTNIYINGFTASEDTLQGIVAINRHTHGGGVGCPTAGHHSHNLGGYTKYTNSSGNPNHRHQLDVSGGAYGAGSHYHMLNMDINHAILDGDDLLSHVDSTSGNYFQLDVSTTGSLLLILWYDKIL